MHTTSTENKTDVQVQGIFINSCSDNGLKSPKIYPNSLWNRLFDKWELQLRSFDVAFMNSRKYETNLTQAWVQTFKPWKWLIMAHSMQCLMSNDWQPPTDDASQSNHIWSEVMLAVHALLLWPRHSGG